MRNSHGADRGRARVARLAFGVAAAIAVQTASAQQAGQLEEILVTAQFRSQNVQQTPIAITAYDSAMLEARGNLNIGDAANIAPNVQVSAHATGFGQMSARKTGRPSEPVPRGSLVRSMSIRPARAKATTSGGEAR